MYIRARRTIIARAQTSAEQRTQFASELCHRLIRLHQDKGRFPRPNRSRMIQLDDRGYKPIRPTIYFCVCLSLWSVNISCSFTLHHSNVDSLGYFSRPERAQYTRQCDPDLLLIMTNACKIAAASKIAAVMWCFP